VQEVLRVSSTKTRKPWDQFQRKYHEQLGLIIKINKKLNSIHGRKKRCCFVHFATMPAEPKTVYKAQRKPKFYNNVPVLRYLGSLGFNILWHFCTLVWALRTTGKCTSCHLFSYKVLCSINEQIAKEARLSRSKLVILLWLSRNEIAK